MIIRESAPLCLAFDSCWGRVYRGWAWIAATITMSSTVAAVKWRRYEEDRADLLYSLKAQKEKAAATMVMIRNQGSFASELRSSITRQT